MVFGVFLTKKAPIQCLFSTTSKNKKQALGALPKTPLSLARPQGGWQTLSTYPYGGVGSIQGVKGKMHDFVDPLTLHLRGVAKLTEADGLETCQGLRSNRAWPAFTGWRRQRSVVRVQEVSCTPAPANARCGQRPRVLARPLGGRAVKMCRRALIFKGFGFTRHRASSV